MSTTLLIGACAIERPRKIVVTSRQPIDYRVLCALPVFDHHLSTTMYLTAILLLLTVSSSLASEQDVLEFTDSDFNNRIGEYETSLVMFYAPW